MSLPPSSPFYPPDIRPGLLFFIYIFLNSLQKFDSYFLSLFLPLSIQTRTHCEPRLVSCSVQIGKPNLVDWRPLKGRFFSSWFPKPFQDLCLVCGDVPSSLQLFSCPFCPPSLLMSPFLSVCLNKCFLLEATFVPFAFFICFCFCRLCVVLIISRFCLPVVWLLWSSLRSSPPPPPSRPRLCLPVSLHSIGWPPLEANFTLPEPCDFLEDVGFVELQREDAEKVLKQYNEEGRKAGPPPDKRFDNRQSGFRGRGSGGSYQRYDNRDGFRGGYQNRSGDGGSGYRGGEALNFSLTFFIITIKHTKHTELGKLICIFSGKK